MMDWTNGFARMDWRGAARRSGAFAVAAALLLAAPGCSFLGFDGEEEIAKPAEGATAQSLFNQAEALTKNGDYRQAIKAYDQVERLHPISTFAKRSMIRSAYAAYRGG